MSTDLYVAGWVLIDGQFVEGHVGMDEGRVSSVEAGPPPVKPMAEGMVLPGLHNAHTHVGDAAVPPPPVDMPPGEVFPPPDGYKHRMLAEMPEEELLAGITRFLEDMTSHGVLAHTDFREGGVAGVELLRHAAFDAFCPPRSRVFGRPLRQVFDSRELGVLLAQVDGIGLSAVMDWPREPIRDVVTAAHDMGLPVALHCSESQREDLSWVLDLAPAFLVHMVFGTPQDFSDLAASHVPVVVCPRSTHRFTKAPPVLEMARAGVDIRVGTDNAMLQGPSVLDEVAFLLGLPENRDRLDPLEALSWALAPAKGSNNKSDIGVHAGSRDLVVLALEGSDPIEFLRGDHSRGAELVMTDGRLWRR